ncbi:MAG: PEP-CTERM sorting domain-containing protein [Casimicrobiaceae bacterium]
MRKRVLALAVGVLALAASLPASAIIGFNDLFDPSEWATTVLGNLIGGSPNPGTTSMSNSDLSITGGDSISPDPANDAPGCAGGIFGFITSPCEIRITTTGFPTPFLFSFRWDYVTSDTAGPLGDLFGMLVNDVRTQLSDPGGPLNQSGLIEVIANTSFGWFINCTDCIGGPATARISAFQAIAQVPEPGLLALLGVGLAGLCVTLRRVA